MNDPIDSLLQNEVPQGRIADVHDLGADRVTGLAGDYIDRNDLLHWG